MKSDTWLLKLNVQKCKVMSYSRHADRNYTYTHDGQSAALDCEDHIKDLDFWWKNWTLVCILLKKLIKHI